MKSRKCSGKEQGFYGVYYPCPVLSHKGMILMLGDSSDDLLVKTGVRFLHALGCHVLAMSAGEKTYAYHSYPLERIEKAIGFLKSVSCTKTGIIGASTTAMIALTAASYLPELTMTMAMSPSDFVMEGFLRDGKDGARERPADGESTLTWKGKALPYLPYAYRHPDYWNHLEAETKEERNLAAARKMFDESERLHPLKEEEKIGVERIQGQVFCIGAEDDTLWDTCRYIHRMQKRLSEHPHTCSFHALTYEHGTHFVFPQSMLKQILPIGSELVVGLCFRAARQYPKECTAARKDIEDQLKRAIREW